VPPGASLPGGLAFDSSGNLYSPNSANAANYIYEITPGGSVGYDTFATGLDNPYGLAFDSDDNLYVASVANDANGYIEEITPNSTVSTLAAVPDAFVIAVQPVPVPATISLFVLGATLFVTAPRTPSARR
jgi:sugar lactone lactonase YvrE